MDYQGYKTQAELKTWINTAFPPVRRPAEQELLIYDDSDLPCRCIREYLRSFNETTLPLAAVRYLHSELLNLSPQGIRWFLPQYLHAALNCDNSLDTLTDMLIYDLYSSDVASTLIRYSLLNKEQLMCLAAILEYLAETHGHSVSAALESVDRLLIRLSVDLISP